MLRRPALSVLVFLVLLAVAAPVAAKPGGGNAAASAACEDGGYLDWTRTDGTTFKNEGDCVRYAARGGTLTPASGLDITFSRAGANKFYYTLTWTGVSPGSYIDLRFCYGTAPLCAISTSQGPVQTSAGSFTYNFFGGITCAINSSLPLSQIIATVTFTGSATPETVALPLPDASACPEIYP